MGRVAVVLVCGLLVLAGCGESDPDQVFLQRQWDAQSEADRRATCEAVGKLYTADRTRQQEQVGAEIFAAVFADAPETLTYVEFVDFLRAACD